MVDNEDCAQPPATKRPKYGGISDTSLPGLERGSMSSDPVEPSTNECSPTSRKISKDSTLVGPGAEDEVTKDGNESVQTVQYQSLLSIEQRQCAHLLSINYSLSGVSHVYNPLDYAGETHTQFVTRYGDGTKKILFLGMNPGPFGMGQNGVPFGDVTFVKDWLKISGSVRKPFPEHPKRPILGLDYTRNEVSGTRFWSLMKNLTNTPENFFKNCYVHNYCPLCYMALTGKNVTPPSMKKPQREQLESVCDRALVEVVQLYHVEWIIGVGKYVEERAKIALKSFSGWPVNVNSMTHPSPINPAANKGNWAELVTQQLKDIGVLSIITLKS